MSLFDIVVNLFESFCYCLFTFLVLKKENKYLSFTFFTLLYFFVLCIFNYYLFSEVLLILIEYFILFLYTIYLNQKEYIQNIFVILFISTINNFSFSVSTLVTFLFYKFPFYDGHAYIMLVMISKSIFLTTILICAKYMKKYHILYTKKLTYCLFALLFLEMIYSSLSDFMFHNLILDQYILTISICINLLSFFLCVIFLESQKEQEERLNMQENIFKIKNQENIYKENQKSIHELNKWKHDMKHIFNSINYHLHQENFRKIKDIVNEYNNLLDSQQLNIQSGNELLDYLISSKIEIIKNNYIHLTIINNIDNIPIDETHLSIIIGNLLDNAIENCGKEKEIILDTGDIGGYFYIKMSNSIDKAVLKDNPHLLTTKKNKENHGIGLNNIYLLLDKYHGQISFDDHNHYFTVRIVIPVNSKRQIIKCI